MKIRHKLQVRWVSILLCILALTLFLGACSNGQGSGNAAPPAAPTPTPTPTPTPIPTPTGTAYSGTGFTLSYPKDWKETNQNVATTNTSVFEPSNAGPSSNIAFTISVSASVASADPDTALNTAAAALKGSLSNAQETTATATIAGDSWKQDTLTGTSQGQQVKGVILADYHSANKKLYLIIIADTAASFDQDNTTIFQPMLASFKFV